MPIAIITGGQYGSEGKGKVAYDFVKKWNAPIVVRVGGSNSGHTIVDSDGKKFVFRVLPTSAILPNVTCVLGAGSYINKQLLLNEIKLSGITKDRLIIDMNAVILTDEDETNEKGGNLIPNIGSTGSGTGNAVIRRIARGGDVLLAKNDIDLQDYIYPSVSFMRDRLKKEDQIVIEGTQGFGLSVLHSPHYPYATSRDTTAAGFLSEAGLSPRDVNHVIMVLRSYPIRVGGNSGPITNEINWDSVSKSSGYKDPLIEYTSVTKRVRRIGEFDCEMVKMAIAHDNPSIIVLNHLDYIDSVCNEKNIITWKAIQYVWNIQKKINRKIDYVGVNEESLLQVSKFF